VLSTGKPSTSLGPGQPLGMRSTIADQGGRAPGMLGCAIEGLAFHRRQGGPMGSAEGKAW